MNFEPLPWLILLLVLGDFVFLYRADRRMIKRAAEDQERLALEKTRQALDERLVLVREIEGAFIRLRMNLDEAKP